MSDLEGLAHRFLEALGRDDSAEITTGGAVSWVPYADAGSDRVRRLREGWIAGVPQPS